MNIARLQHRTTIVTLCCIVTLVGCGLFGNPALARAGNAISLRPPFDGTKRLTSYFDHRYPTYGQWPNTTYSHIVIYTGEDAVDCDTSGIYCYDGHNGYDWSMDTGTPILASAMGTVVYAGWHDPGNHNAGYGLMVRIHHGNGYETLYGYLSSIYVTVNTPVQTGALIGASGNTGHSTGAHLHFSVYHEGYATDPFGWRGAGQDPLVSWSGEASRCLWRSRDEDIISCADTIIEDFGQDFDYSAGWTEDTKGHGAHMIWTANVNSPPGGLCWVQWNPEFTYAGWYKVYAFIPYRVSATANARYTIYHANGQTTRSVSQLHHPEEWVYLGTYRFTRWGNSMVELTDYTGEPTFTRQVSAGAIKFRLYTVFLPLVLRQSP